MTGERNINPLELERPHSRRFTLGVGSAIIVDSKFMLTIEELGPGNQVLARIISDLNNPVITSKELAASKIFNQPKKEGLGSKLTRIRPGPQSAIFVANKYKVTCTDISIHALINRTI